jgi:heme/copper-type cytochrome/quinol oxidase subunit 3
MNVRPAIDVSGLEIEEFGSRDTLWWGNMGLIVVESTSFALLIASYFFYRMRYTQWPPDDAGVPWLTFALPNLILVVAICYPLSRINAKAPHASRRWLTIMLGISAALMAVSLVLRVFEFQTLHTEYYEHSYGSITWALLFVHGVEVAFAMGEAVVLAIYAATNDVDRKHRADMQILATFWYFLAITWVVIFAVVYVAGRML